MLFDKCPICEHKNNKKIIKSQDYRFLNFKDYFSLYKCQKCGFIYLNPIPASSKLNKYYSRDYYQLTYGKFENFINQKLLELKCQGLFIEKNPGRLLDIGCGNGIFLEKMKQYGFEINGIDVSSDAVKIAQQKKLSVITSDLKEKLFPENYFDYITLWHVLEHIKNLRKTINIIKKLLKKEGILVIEVPNIDSFNFNIFQQYYYHLDLPRHLWHFSNKTLTLFLEKNGFKIIKITNFSLDFPLSASASLNNYLNVMKVQSLIKKSLKLFLFLPLLLISFISRFIPGKGEIIRIYAQKV